MSNFNSRSGQPMVADLDGWSFEPEMRSYAPPLNSYMQNVNSNSDDFGFDPPTSATSIPSIESHYTPKSIESIERLPHWAGLHTDPRRASLQGKFDEPSTIKQRPYAASAVALHGQLTPPRSNSATSNVSLQASIEEESLPSRRKRNTKVEVKTEDSPKTDAPASTRKRKASRKSTSATQPTRDPEDDKRKTSLEKNRLAAAKCRVNKKEKTDQLQRDSHDKAVENTFLRQTIMQMKEEVQQLQTMLMSHSSSDHCKNPQSIHEALSAAGPDTFADQMANSRFLSMQAQGGAEHTTMRQLGHEQSVHGDYFQPREAAPALPEFNLSADFEVRTPMIE